MGVEFHITRAESWADNADSRIGAEEWLAYVAGDPELRRRPENGEHFVQWLGRSEYEEPWLDWRQGNISTKWPDTALYRKMLEIAVALDARVQDDDGNLYVNETDWEFNPNANKAALASNRNPWWKRILSK